MSTELWRSVVPIYAFMIVNFVAVAAALVWAARRRLFSASEEQLRRAPLHDDSPFQEKDHG